MNCPYCKRPVPDKIRLHKQVCSELPRIVEPNPTIAEPGIYNAAFNSHGAIHIEINGRKLGIKPGEYEFVWEDDFKLTETDKWQLLLEARDKEIADLRGQLDASQTISDRLQQLIIEITDDPTFDDTNYGHDTQ